MQWRGKSGRKWTGTAEANCCWETTCPLRRGIIDGNGPYKTTSDIWNRGGIDNWICYRLSTKMTWAQKQSNIRPIKTWTRKDKWSWFDKESTNGHRWWIAGGQIKSNDKNKEIRKSGGRRGVWCDWRYGKEPNRVEFENAPIVRTEKFIEHFPSIVYSRAHRISANFMKQMALWRNCANQRKTQIRKCIYCGGSDEYSLKAEWWFRHKYAELQDAHIIRENRRRWLNDREKGALLYYYYFNHRNGAVQKTNDWI